MRKKRVVSLLLAVITICLVFTGCQSEEAKNVDERIDELIKNEVSLKVGNEVTELNRLIQGFSEKEQKSLKNLESFESFAAQYKLLEDEAVQEIEAIINALPSLDEIKLDSEKEINAAAEAFNKATNEVKSRVSNKAVLDAVKEKIEEVKADSWVACSVCGGSGRVKCSICNGTGSKKAKYTTPNGKTWDVSQDCPTTQTCSACLGKGGSYVEMP